MEPPVAVGPGDGLRDLLVFSHANGFPAATYAQVLSPLARLFEISHVDAFGHAPQYRVSRGWPGLTRQLEDHIATRAGDRPLWLVGHSLGGYLSLLAAARLGARVAGVVLLDSPLIGGVTAHLIKLGRRTGLDRHLMPLRQTLQRRTHWPDVDAVRAHFEVKPAFARWDPRVLADYASAATVADPAGRRLMFEREIEHGIYSTLPTRSVRLAAHRVTAPIAFVGGRQSREVSQIGVRATRAVVGARMTWVEGSHLYPMERPDATVQAVVAAIEGMRDEARSDTDAGRAA